MPSSSDQSLGLSTSDAQSGVEDEGLNRKNNLLRAIGIWSQVWYTKRGLDKAGASSVLEHVANQGGQSNLAHFRQ